MRSPTLKTLASSRPPPTDTRIQTWVRLAHAYHRIIRRLERALDRHQLSLAQFEALAHLHYSAGIVQNDLARRLLVTKGNVCGLIDRLTASKLVKRQSDPDDRRANRLYLTARGRRLIGKTLPAHLALIKKMLSDLTTSELLALGDLLARLAPAPKSEECPRPRGRRRHRVATGRLQY